MFKGEKKHGRLCRQTRNTNDYGEPVVPCCHFRCYPLSPFFFIPPSAIANPHAAGAASVTALPNKPSIAVLPFTNMSGDPDQEHFSDGMSDTLITDLSKVGSLFIIARNSTCLYKGKAIKPQQVSQELGCGM